MARTGEIGRPITLGAKFYVNGALFDPYAIVGVRIKDARVGGNILATLTPTRVSPGTYEIVWPATATFKVGVYYDEWIWQAEVDMPTNTRVYSFRLIAYTDRGTKAVKGPLFVGHQEVDFFNSITKEVIQKIVAQKIIYYSVSDKHTKSHPIYDEAIKKTVFTPVEINALILYNEPSQTATRFSIDTIYSIEVYFHFHELKERNIIPREGDFVKFGQILYEIEKLNQPQIVYGQIQNKVMVKATCRVSRKSQFEVLDNIPGNEE